MRTTTMRDLLQPVFCIVFYALASVGSSQGLNNLWMGGYESVGGLPWGGTDIDFSTGSPVATYRSACINAKPDGPSMWRPCAW